ncbi:MULTISPECIES: isoprenylcysteine carboxylmethyltransferase family protein [unclassified Flavobacterium]|uniref:methyltransferase family protein n=1 Tax=unclassified Flavobacterium TaxID=196869 RepID=UPI001F12C4B8|nr:MULTISPECIES: isoprenylcysteine carboxylmethyltransferase family protein [unclassified Flavobacterium]UMY65175.1 isoprenylcysteine carboxylmethyltransferase family protein [Flavobacterium sp. HJ-32-4]
MALLEEFEQQGNWLFRRRGQFPMLFLLIGLGLYLYDLAYDVPFFLGEEAARPYFWGCVVISLLGLFVRIYTVGHTPVRTSGRNREEQIADTLNTSGIYATVRHPLYLGNFLIWLGPALLTAHFWFVASFCLFYWLYYERIMFTEEQFLRAKFGATFTDWAAKTPAFIPALSQFRPNTVLFSWKKVFINEKNGLASIFVVFLIFDLTGQAITDVWAPNIPLIAFTLLSLLLLAVLKVVKMTTTYFLIEER